MKTVAHFFTLILLIATCTAHGREWVGEKGVKFVADYVSCDGANVTMANLTPARPGAPARFVYPLARLSAADREFVTAEMQKAAAPIRKGLSLDLPIKPWHPVMADYLKQTHAKRIFDAFDKHKGTETWKQNTGTGKEQFDYDGTSAQTIVYVPASYDGLKPFGAYVHISPGDGGDNGAAFQPIMDRLNLIYISPKGTSNGQPMLRRIHMAVDALESVRKEWKLDPKRCVVGGLSGGGHMAMLTQAMFPELFTGAVSHAAQSYLPTFPPAYYNGGHFPGLTGTDFTAGALKGRKWVVISGDKDKNYQEILTTSKQWEAHKLAYRFINVPGMAHTNAPPEQLEEALKWTGL